LLFVEAPVRTARAKDSTFQISGRSLRDEDGILSGLHAALSRHPSGMERRTQQNRHVRFGNRALFQILRVEHK